MIKLLVTSPDYEQDEATKRLWKWLSSRFEQDEGICYYKHPVVVTNTGVMPELTLLSRNNQPLAMRCFPYQLDDIQSIEKEIWTINNAIFDSPFLELEDFVEGLKYRFNKDRTLRHRLQPKAVLALPLISSQEFEHKFGGIVHEDIRMIWAGGDTNSLLCPLARELSDLEWRHTRAIIQGVSPLKDYSNKIPTQKSTLGEAIQILDRQIALLDEEQEQAALQIAPGPQAIRGLAGTGKTILLAMKAANIHLRFPEKKILFTFNTQSLYNQAKKLISRFYRHFSDVDPNWEMLHIRHAWGGYRRTRPGVYSELSARQGVIPINLEQARERNVREPFKVCCQSALSLPIYPEYDFILVDEFQDFPREFSELLMKLSHPPHQIYFAYDELQNLTDPEEPHTPSQQFGLDKEGKLGQLLNDTPYPGNIDKDLVLHKSYRCPHSVLMLAHAIGLGLYNPNGCIQMLEKEISWETIGYKIKRGPLQKGQKVVIERSFSNSPNLIAKTYNGSQKLIDIQVFENKEFEMEWVADSINKDIRDEKVPPEQILVICLEKRRFIENYLPPLQKRLVEHGIASTIPGLVDDSAAFSEQGKVTLSNIFRAKGNEAAIVYILSFNSLYDYVDAIENRNRAFTAISRSKAWVRITGVGQKMQQAKSEIDHILSDQPYFKFFFPDMNKIRRLDAETSKRRREVAKAENSTKNLLDLDLKALAAVNPELLEKLLKRIEEAKRENQ